MPTYKVKSRIARGDPKKRRGYKKRIYKPGNLIDLTLQEAWEIRHALYDPPPQDPSGPQLPKEIVASLKGNPLHPESGVELYWKTRGNVKRPASNWTPLEKKLEPMRQKTLAKTAAAAVRSARPVVPARPAQPIVTPPAPVKPVQPIATPPPVTKPVPPPVTKPVPPAAPKPVQPKPVVPVTTRPAPVQVKPPKKK